jgi:cellulose biosynthesis protein BcsQ
MPTEQKIVKYSGYLMSIMLWIGLVVPSMIHLAHSMQQLPNKPSCGKHTQNLCTVKDFLDLATPNMFSVLMILGVAIAGSMLALLVLIKVVDMVCGLAFVSFRTNRHESRNKRNNELLRRVAEGLADNPDYRTLCRISEELRRADLQGEDVAKVRADVDRLKEKLRSEEQSAALAPIMLEMESLRFRHDPAGAQEQE